MKEILQGAWRPASTRTLPKPFDEDRLLAVIAQVMNVASQRRRQMGSGASLPPSQPVIGDP